MVARKRRSIDWSKFNWQKIYQVAEDVNASFEKKGTQFNFVRSDFLEHAIAEYSEGQLTFIGEIGRDFRGVDGRYYECKTQLSGMFQKETTKSVIIKNHHTKNKKELQETFDHMLLVGYQTYGKKKFLAGLISFADATENIKKNDATMSTQIDLNKVDFIVGEDYPFEDDYEPIDMHQAYMECISDGIRKIRESE